MIPHIPSAAWQRDIHAESQSRQMPKVPNLFDGGMLQGVPLGGFGTGSIGRDWQGSFRRWTLKPGALKHFVEPANTFALWVKVEGELPQAFPLQPCYPPDAPADHAVRHWYSQTPALEGTYHALFPKAWYVYSLPGLPLELVCEQFSPVLPHNYRETSWPVGVFRWVLRNTGGVPLEASLLFSFANLNGWFGDYGRERPTVRSSGNFNMALETAELSGLLLDHQRTRGVPRENRGQWCLAVAKNPGLHITRCSTWDIQRDAVELWSEFQANGELSEREGWVASSEFPAQDSGHIAGALAVKTRLGAGESIEIPFSLVWDLPVLAFGSGREYFRRYTRFFGNDGKQAARIAQETLTHWPQWSQAIDKWHQYYIRQARYSDSYYRMLFNELYLLLDGYTVWTDKAVDGGAAEDFFALIECPDYPFYNTLDLWVYGSFALLPNWPELEKKAIAEFARQVLREDLTPRRHYQSQTVFASTLSGHAPHDLGSPLEDPLERVNAYNFQDATRWKDLNSHFILTLWRDHLAFKDLAFLKTHYPAAVAAIEQLNQHDHDGDGLIENANQPDQTFDMIPMWGPSAYCGGLWLAALSAVERMAELLGDAERAIWCRARIERGGVSFVEKLWTGTHLRIDTQSPYREKVFAEQLFGIWYARIVGLGDLLEEGKAQQALQTIFEQNCLGVQGGKAGVVNISELRTDQTQPGNFAGQADEVLVGINFSLANQLAEYGLHDQAEHVLETMHRLLYHERQMWFRTPAALVVDQPKFPAILNLRPLSIWGQEAVAWLRG